MSIARFTNFSNNKKIQECFFMLPMTKNGLYKLDTIYSTDITENNKGTWFYSYNDVMSLSGFIISNKKGSPSTYKTAAAFINRIKKELI